MRTKNMLVLATVLVGLFCQEVRAFCNSSTGRWLSRDLIQEEGGLSLYANVGNATDSHIGALGLALYAVDGTWTKASDQANPWQLFNETKENPKRYWRGPVDGLWGTDSTSIARTVKNQICADFCQWKKDGRDLAINMTGWSRGAVIVMGVANLLNFPGCRCDGSGPCVRFFGTRYLRIQVNWVGLFDAVSMTSSLWWVPHDVPPNVLRFDHAMKTTRSQPQYPTFRFNQATEEFFDQFNGSPTTHADIGMSKIRSNNNAYNWIKDEAIANHVAF